MNSDPANPGYRHIIFKPQPVDELDYVTYINNTSYGESGITWRREKGQFFIDVTVPVGSTAEVFVPEKNSALILESGKKITEANEVELDRIEGEYTVILVKSGEYSFKVVEGK